MKPRSRRRPTRSTRLTLCYSPTIDCLWPATSTSARHCRYAHRRDPVRLLVPSARRAQTGAVRTRPVSLPHRQASHRSASRDLPSMSARARARARTRTRTRTRTRARRRGATHRKIAAKDRVVAATETHRQNHDAGADVARETGLHATVHGSARGECKSNFRSLG